MLSPVRTGRLARRAGRHPVVLLHGPRQCGKTTLARTVAEPAGFGYLTFDDDNLAAAARSDPTGFVADLPPRMVLDEIQRVPELFTSIKAVVDRDRRPGRFLLTGSANVLLLPKLDDSLAGRIEAQRLYPLGQCELARHASGFLPQLFSGGFKLARHERLGPELAQRIVAGGYPAGLARKPGRRREWYRAYVQTLVQRDVRDLGRIASLDALPRLLELAAGQTAQLMNVSELAGPFQLSRPTIRDYMTLLERIKTDRLIVFVDVEGQFGLLVRNGNITNRFDQCRAKTLPLRVWQQVYFVDFGFSAQRIIELV